MKRTTVKEIKQMLDMMPDEMEVQFTPITGAFTGTMDPMRVEDFYFYDHDGSKGVMPSAPGAVMHVHLVEDHGWYQAHPKSWDQVDEPSNNEDQGWMGSIEIDGVQVCRTCREPLGTIECESCKRK